jgi:hypothetical protein
MAHPAFPTAFPTVGDDMNPSQDDLIPMGMSEQHSVYRDAGSVTYPEILEIEAH